MSDVTSIEELNWPPAAYQPPKTFKKWLTLQREYPGAQARSRRVSHNSVPYRVKLAADEVTAETLARAAAHYLGSLQKYLQDQGVRRGIGLPRAWVEQLFPGEDTTPDDNQILQWLPVWPGVGDPDPGIAPVLASWNLSRTGDHHDLPARIVLVASEWLGGSLNSHVNVNVGLRVPMAVERNKADELIVTIRSMSAELPNRGFISLSQNARRQRRDQKILIPNSYLLSTPLIDADTGLLSRIERNADAETGTVSLDEIALFDPRLKQEADQPRAVLAVSKGRGNQQRKGPDTNPSFQIHTTFDKDLRAIFSERDALVTHAAAPDTTRGAPPTVDVFVQTPSAGYEKGNEAKPYNWTARRPPRGDHMLERYLVERPLNFGRANKIALESPGFFIHLSDLVPADRKQAKGLTKKVKSITKADTNHLPPRRNVFSALNAYCNSLDFFALLKAFGMSPKTYVARAKLEAEVFYRAGITPGSGGDGRTINAQVKYDCRSEEPKPVIRIHLALGNLNRWDRPEHADGKRKWAEPLGIASSGRWMMHEFGHYLLAARIGQLEFDFVHSPGDAMAAVSFDPISRLSDARDGVSDQFRGVTYPFVFATRRHDRTPLLGWAWYGGLNRAIVENPPTGCGVTKGYLTEQILSSTIFRLYRSLGGDTLLNGDPAAGPDWAVRQRASFVTLFLLISAIESFAQSPSTAEMLEQAMEEAAALLQGDLQIVPYRALQPPQNPDPAPWRGGLGHKPIRWAFEAQGMFPKDRTKTHNTVGRPPAVDLYVADRRPTSEKTTAGPIPYGPGNYGPVSLHWSETALWMMQTEGRKVQLGNRGHKAATGVTARVWFGHFTGALAGEGWENTELLTWDRQFGPIKLPQIPPGKTLGDTLQELNTEIEASQDAFLLLEVSCPFDHANTDPNSGFPLAVTGADFKAQLPRTPRGLMDLVSTDNNLGFLLL